MIKTGRRTTVGMVITGVLPYASVHQAGGSPITEVYAPCQLRGNVGPAAGSLDTVSAPYFNLAVTTRLSGDPMDLIGHYPSTA